MRASTIRVVLSGKLLKQLVLYLLTLLRLPSTKKHGVPMPAQRRHARASRRFPNFHAFVVAATINLFAVRTEGNTRDIAVK